MALKSESISAVEHIAWQAKLDHLAQKYDMEKMSLPLWKNLQADAVHMGMMTTKNTLVFARNFESDLVAQLDAKDSVPASWTQVLEKLNNKDLTHSANRQFEKWLGLIRSLETVQNYRH